MLLQLLLLFLFVDGDSWLEGVVTKGRSSAYIIMYLYVSAVVEIERSGHCCAKRQSRHGDGR